MSASLLFVCSQNICRSVAAHTVFDYLIAETTLDAQAHSAGIWANHGQISHDPIMYQIATRRGYQLRNTPSVQLQTLVATDYDYVLIFEQAHCQPVKEWMDGRGEPELLTRYSKYFYNKELVMPEPVESDYLLGYTQILDLIEDSCLGLYEFIARKSIS